MLRLAVDRDLVQILVEGDFVCPGATVDDVFVAVISLDGVVPLCRLDGVLAGVPRGPLPGKDDIISSPADDVFDAAHATESITTGATVQLVIAVSTWVGLIVAIEAVAAT